MGVKTDTFTEQTHDNAQDDNWTLNGKQVTFMLQHHNVTEAARENDDTEFLRELAASEEFKLTFGEMGWDAAYDRYESMLEESRADS